MLRLAALRRAVERSATPGVIGAGVSAVAAAMLARYAPQVPRAWALVALCPWALVAVLARRALRRPLSLAHEVDRGLDADAAVLTAAELCLDGRDVSAPVRARITRDADARLAGKRAWHAVAPPSRRARAMIALSVALAVASQRAPIPAAAPRRAVASRPARRDPAAAREAHALADALREVATRDPDRADALRRLAGDADALARTLDVGAPPDAALEALDALTQQADPMLAWAADEAHRRAAEAALAELDDPSLRDALARGDLARLDEAVRALADSREASARQAAEASLRRAAQAARQQGRGDLADALDDEADLLHRRGASSELARAVAQSLAGTPGAQRVADHLARNEDRALSQALDAAMREVDRGLTPDERRRLAQALARMASQADPGSRAELDRAARAATPEEMRAAMQQMVDALRRGALDHTRAGRTGAGDARGQLARLRLAMQPGGAPGAGPSSGQRDPGHVDTVGHTQAIARQGFVAPVQAAQDPARPGVPVSSERFDTTGARASEPSEVRLREAAPAALQGIERTAVPEPYRDQLREYFAP